MLACIHFRSSVSMFGGCAQEATAELVAPDPGTVVEGVLRLRPRHGLSPKAPVCLEGCSYPRVPHVQAEQLLRHGRQVLCTACHLTFGRDTNAANNTANCLWQHAEDGSRPRGSVRKMRVQVSFHLCHADP